jgi:hypothetical protein
MHGTCHEAGSIHPERAVYLLKRPTDDGDPLSTRSASRNEVHSGARHAEHIGQKREQHGIGSTVNRGCLEPDLDRISMPTNDFCSARPWLDVERQDGRRAWWRGGMASC